MIRQLSGLITGLVGMLKQVILRSLKIETIKNEDLFFLGWLYALVNLILGVLNLAGAHFSAAALTLACGLAAGISLVYIGKTCGLRSGAKIELLDIRLELDSASAGLLADLLRQGLLYTGSDAIELSQEGIYAVRQIANNIDKAAGKGE